MLFAHLDTTRFLYQSPGLNEDQNWLKNDEVAALKGLHVEHQNDENFSFFGQTKRGQRQLSSKKLTNLLVGGANTVERVKILFNEPTSHAHQNGFVN